MLKNMCCYLAVPANAINIYDYACSIYSEHNDFFKEYRTPIGEDGKPVFITADTFFKAAGIPEEYRMIMLKIDMPFLFPLALRNRIIGREVASGLPYELYPRFGENLLFVDSFLGICKPLGNGSVSYTKKADFESKANVFTYSQVVDFMKKLLDYGLLEQYKEALSKSLCLNSHIYSGFNLKDVDRELKSIVNDNKSISVFPDVWNVDEALYELLSMSAAQRWEPVMPLLKKNQRILEYYGINIDLSLVQDFRIINRDKKSISFKTGNALVTIDLTDRVPNTYDVSSASITICENGVVDKYYYALKDVINIDDAGKKLAIARETPGSMLVADVYSDAADTNRQYSLRVSETFSGCYGGPSREIVVSEVEPVDQYDNNGMGLSYSTSGNTQQWELLNPGITFTSYDYPRSGKMKSDGSICTYSSESYAGLFSNGDVDDEELNILVSKWFDTNSSRRFYVNFEDDCSFRIIFRGPADMVIIQKRGNQMIFVVETNSLSTGWRTIQNNSIIARSGTISTSDLEDILTVLKYLYISDEFRDFVQNAIDTYIRFHQTGEIVDYHYVYKAPFGGLPFEQVRDAIVKGECVPVEHILRQIRELFLGDREQVQVKKKTK